MMRQGNMFNNNRQLEWESWFVVVEIKWLPICLKWINVKKISVYINKKFILVKVVSKIKLSPIKIYNKYSRWNEILVLQ